MEPIVIPSRSKHTATVIFLHGLGDSGAGWQPIAETLAPGFPHVKWVLPSARPQRVTISMGLVTPSWFDIRTLGSLDSEDKEDERGVLASVDIVQKLISDEVASGLSSHRIILGGFSQGAGLTLATGMLSQQKLGGLIALSGFLPIRSTLSKRKSEHVGDLPIFMAHGRQDQVVPYAMGEASYKFLCSNFGIKQVADSGIGLTFKSYSGMGHSADPREISDMVTWLKQVIPE